MGIKDRKERQKVLDLDIIPQLFAALLNIEGPYGAPFSE
jgi:hypothetical protein